MLARKKMVWPFHYKFNAEENRMLTFEPVLTTFEQNLQFCMKFSNLFVFFLADLAF